MAATYFKLLEVMVKNDIIDKKPEKILRIDDRKVFDQWTIWIL